MIPLATTTISVLRVPADEPADGEDYRDPYDAQPERTVVVAGVRARIGQPSSRERVAGGTQAITDLALWCDPFNGALLATDHVLDEATGDVYELAGPGFHQRGLDLDHFVAPIKQIVGLA